VAKRKSTKDKQRSTKHTYKTKDRVTKTPLKIGGEQVLRKGEKFLLYLWVQTVLLLSPTCSFIRMRQTSYRGFSRKIKRN
jgi:hypothetical protein